MSYGKFVRVRFAAGFLLLTLVVFAAACAKPAAPNLPKDILGISVGMSRENAEPRLRQIAEFERDEGKRQQIWRLKNDANFSRMAVGYGDEQQIRYVTGFVGKEAPKERLRFDGIGDLATATKEVIAPHHRYIWEVAGNGDKPAYLVNAYGMEPEFLTMLTLTKKTSPGETEEEAEKEIR